MSNFKFSKRLIGSKKQLGQGMTEYIIIVALIAIGAIGVYSAFGRTVQSQMAAVSQGLAGKGNLAGNDITQAETEAAAADKVSQTKLGLDNFATNDKQQ